MAKQVLYLSYDGITDALGQSQILPYVLGLEKLGHSFHIISFEKKETYFLFRANIEQQLKGDKNHLAPIFLHQKTSGAIYLVRFEAHEEKSTYLAITA